MKQRLVLGSAAIIVWATWLYVIFFTNTFPEETANDVLLLSILIVLGFLPLVIFLFKHRHKPHKWLTIGKLASIIPALFSIYLIFLLILFLG